MEEMFSFSMEFSRALADMLAPHRRGRLARPQDQTSLESSSTGDGNPAGEPPIIVLPSSIELFYFYRQILAKYSRGKVLYDLCALHDKWLKIYAGECCSCFFHYATHLDL
jgi:hypothetical protein